MFNILQVEIQCQRGVGISGFPYKVCPQFRYSIIELKILPWGIWLVVELSLYLIKYILLVWLKYSIYLKR